MVRKQTRVVRVLLREKKENLREVSFKTQYSFQGTNVDFTLISRHERRPHTHFELMALTNSIA